jgi:hypothetical protein
MLADFVLLLSRLSTTGATVSAPAMLPKEKPRRVVEDGGVSRSVGVGAPRLEAIQFHTPHFYNAHRVRNFHPFSAHRV